HVLRRLLADDEQGEPELRGVLLACPTADPLHARVVRHVPLAVEYPAALDLPAAAGVVDVVQAVAGELVDQCHVRPPLVSIVTRTAAGARLFLVVRACAQIPAAQRGAGVSGAK